MAKEQISLTGTAKTLTAATWQSKAIYRARVSVGNGGPICYWTDGSTPTATSGNRAGAGATFVLETPTELSNFSAINQAENTTLDVEYLEDPMRT